MFLVVLVLMFFVTVLLVRKDKQKSTKYLSAMLICYSLAIFSVLVYVSKDVFYSNVVNNYFSLPKGLWRYLIFLHIPKDFIIGIMNAAVLAVIYFGYQFSTVYMERIAEQSWRKKYGLMIIFAFEWLIYFPLVQYVLYITIFPRLLDQEAIQLAANIWHGMTMVFNMGIILLSFYHLYKAYRHVFFPRFMKSYFVGEGISYILLMLSFSFIFWFAPGFLIKVSKVASYRMYLSIPLSDSYFVYNTYPYLVVLTTILCAICIYKIVNLRMQMKNEDFTITRQIDASDTTSKIFCHYMKNEILAIQSCVEILEVKEESEKERQDIMDRCNNLYERLDIIHRSTRHAQLNLSEVTLKPFIKEIMERMHSDFKECRVTLKFQDTEMKVLLDKNYFEQAFTNILKNAIEAVEGKQGGKKEIQITLQLMNNWVILSVKDNGVGIAKDDLHHIFTPLYSSKPIKKHWGVGLALTHRIIMAHEGQIEVESEENVGTDIRILLPDIGRYMT